MRIGCSLNYKCIILCRNTRLITCVYYMCIYLYSSLVRLFIRVFWLLKIEIFFFVANLHFKVKQNVKVVRYVHASSIFFCNNLLHLKLSMAKIWWFIFFKCEDFSWSCSHIKINSWKLWKLVVTTGGNKTNFKLPISKFQVLYFNLSSYLHKNSVLSKSQIMILKSYLEFSGYFKIWVTFHNISVHISQ